MKETSPEAEVLAEDVGTFIGFDGQQLTSPPRRLHRKSSGAEFPQLVGFIRSRSVNGRSIQKRRHLIQLFFNQFIIIYYNLQYNLV